MINFRDRTPRFPNRKRLVDGGTTKTVTISYDDSPTDSGTPINRKTMMGLQGWINSEISFQPNGQIQQTFNGNTANRLVTTFNSDGSITEELIENNNKVATRKTTFTSDGRIITTFS